MHVIILVNKIDFNFTALLPNANISYNSTATSVNWEVVVSDIPGHVPRDSTDGIVIENRLYCMLYLFSFSFDRVWRLGRRSVHE